MTKLAALTAIIAVALTLEGWGGKIAHAQGMTNDLRVGLERNQQAEAEAEEERMRMMREEVEEGMTAKYGNYDASGLTAEQLEDKRRALESQGWLGQDGQLSAWGRLNSREEPKPIKGDENDVCQLRFFGRDWC